MDNLMWLQTEGEVNKPVYFSWILYMYFRVVQKPSLLYLIPKKGIVYCYFG